MKKAIILLFCAVVFSNNSAIYADLFMSDPEGGNIYRFTPSGTRSTFATGLNYPGSLAFDSNGNLFVTDGVSNAVIYKYTPDGT
jgi:sugar lactone lactonase YvrE